MSGSKELPDNNNPSSFLNAVPGTESKVGSKAEVKGVTVDPATSAESGSAAHTRVKGSAGDTTTLASESGSTKVKGAAGDPVPLASESGSAKERRLKSREKRGSSGSENIRSSRV
jgi:hypothetical protein